MNERTPWAQLLALAPSPEEFWRMSLREWRALNASPSAAVLGRAAFDALAARFPDEKA
jgi:uncharacterized phage protein (TIGR02216 family)